MRKEERLNLIRKIAKNQLTIVAQTRNNMAEPTNVVSHGVEPCLHCSGAIVSRRVRITRLK